MRFLLRQVIKLYEHTFCAVHSAAFRKLLAQRVILLSYCGDALLESNALLDGMEKIISGEGLLKKKYAILLCFSLDDSKVFAFDKQQKHWRKYFQRQKGQTCAPKYRAEAH